MQGSTELLNSSPEDVLRDAFWLVIHQLQQPGSLPACRGPQWFNGPSTMHGVRVLTGRWLVGGFNRAGQSIPKPFRIIIFVGSCCWDGKKWKPGSCVCWNVQVCRWNFHWYSTSLCCSFSKRRCASSARCAASSAAKRCCCKAACWAARPWPKSPGKPKSNRQPPFCQSQKTEVEVVSNLWCMLIGAKFW